jgi:proton-dependent oligopeptide transporter, POT family
VVGADVTKADLAHLCPATTRSSRELLGHPSGLFIAAGTEFWDRISFHGMQALLVLYMVERLLLPGHIEHIVGFARLRSVIEVVTGPLSPQALATQIFGLYVGLVSFTPVFGGLIGDRLLGRRSTVVLGALLMTAGHLCMAFDQPFLLALLLLIIGAGCLRGNLISQVGTLYSKDDRRRDDGFQIYVAVLNCGAMLAPLITGSLAQAYGWHYGFAFAGVGMLVGLGVYLGGQRYLSQNAPRDISQVKTRLGSAERRIVLYLFLMLPLLTPFWIGQSQIWNTYNLWARDHVDLLIAGWKIPVPWLQAAEGIAAVTLVPPLVMFWRWQAARHREPDDVTKIAIGSLAYGATLLMLAGGNLVANADGKIPLFLVLAFHFLSQLAYLYVSPIAVALFSRSAPATINSTMVSVYYISIFIGSTISGRLGGLYERLPSSQFWLLHAAIVGAGGTIILMLAPRLRRELAPTPIRSS